MQVGEENTVIQIFQLTEEQAAVAHTPLIDGINVAYSTAFKTRRVLARALVPSV